LRKHKRHVVRSGCAPTADDRNRTGEEIAGQRGEYIGNDRAYSRHPLIAYGEDDHGEAESG